MLSTDSSYKQIYQQCDMKNIVMYTSKVHDKVCYDDFLCKI